MAQVGEAATILVHSFGELLDQVKQRWEEYRAPVYQSIVDNVFGFTRHLFILCRPVLLGIVLRSVHTIPHAQKARVLGKYRLLSQ